MLCCKAAGQSPLRASAGRLNWPLCHSRATSPAHLVSANVRLGSIFEAPVSVAPHDAHMTFSDHERLDQYRFPGDELPEGIVWDDSPGRSTDISPACLAVGAAQIAAV